jgi:hypothetical protein
MGKSIILVEMTVTLDFQNGTTPKLDSYSGSSTPGGKNVVSSTGSIDLTKVDKSSDDSTITVITFKLASKNNPNKINAWFVNAALLTGLGAPYKGAELQSACLAEQAAILDLDADGQTYQYCLTLGYGNPATPGVLALDPPIINRTGGN